MHNHERVAVSCPPRAGQRPCRPAPAFMRCCCTLAAPPRALRRCCGPPYSPATASRSNAGCAALPRTALRRTAHLALETVAFGLGAAPARPVSRERPAPRLRSPLANPAISCGLARGSAMHVASIALALVECCCLPGSAREAFRALGARCYRAQAASSIAHGGYRHGADTNMHVERARAQRLRPP